MSDQVPARIEESAPAAYQSTFRDLGRNRRGLTSQQAVKQACQMIAVGASVLECARRLQVNERNLDYWLNLPRHAADYARARKDRASNFVEQSISISNKALSGEVDPRAADVAIKARQWIAARMDRRAWGDQPTPDDGAAPDMPLDQLAAQIQALESQTGLMKRLGVSITETRTVTVVAETKD